MYYNQQCVSIAVIVNILHLLHITRGSSLIPQLLAAAAPKPGGLGFNSLGQGLLIHVSQHQYLAVFFLYNGRQ